MHKQLKLTLRTPEATLVSREVDSVYLTTEAGDLMLLPDHSALSASMTYSPILIKEGETVEEYLAYSGTLFFSNVENEARILVQRADLKDKIDYDGLKAYLKLIEERIEKGQDLSDLHIRYLKDQKLALVQGFEANKK